MANDKSHVESNDRELIISRTFDAPRDLLFRMWSSCEHLKHWWGPKEWPMKECTMDFREGGVWHYCLRGPKEGDASWGKAVYQEIKKPEKIVYEDCFADKDGNVSEEMPAMLITVEFIRHDDKTELLSSTVFDSPETLKSIVEMGAVEGMNSSLDRLEEHLVKVSAHNS